MKKKSQNLLRNQTFITIIANMAVAFFITTAILIVYFNDYVGKNQTKIIYLSAEKKLLELNAFFNSAENIVNQYEDFILQTLDEDKILEDSDYEKQYMENVSRMMASAISDVQKGTVCPYFRMNIEKYGPTRGVFLTGSYKKSFVNIRTTDLSKYSPSDTEHVGWYYLPLWKKAPVWTPPYENLALGQKMISYSVPIYREDRFIGVVGIDLSLAIIDEMVKSFQIENSTGLLIGTEQNLITLNTQAELSKAVEHSAELAVILEQFGKTKNQKLKRFIWDGTGHYGILTKLDNGMTYIPAVAQNEILKPIYGLILSVTAAFIAVCFLTSVLIMFVQNRIISPIKIVSQTTNRLARGELYIDIPYKSKNEIGTLANNIRLMTTQLKEYIEYISEQTQKEREAKEAALTESQINAAASQAKSAFLANMSHEIRTPINAVLGMNEMILRESDDKTILGYALNIKTAGSNLLSIVNDVLDFSKIEAGKMELLPDNYEVSSLIIDLVNMTRERAQNKGLKYELNISPSLPKTLFGDSVRIKQCILNLLTNAIKYTKEGTVTFTIDFNKTDEEKILLSVHVNDTGSGIKPEDMEKLFTPFERIEEGKNRTIEGSGLGISIVRRLLNMMGSELKVQSTYGKGSDFSFTIEQKVTDWTACGDLNEAYAESVEQMEKYKEKLHAPKARLLFVDDTAMNLDVIKGLLKNTDMTIDTVLSGKEALESVKNNTYDILFIDHRMPEMDGIETLHAMKALPNNKSAGKPCIALTANAISGVKKMYLNEGFDDYLSKPVNPTKLEEMIRHYLPQEYLEDVPEDSTDSNEFSEFLQKLNETKELDAQAAIQNCAVPELLFSTIKKYHESIDEKAQELQNFFDSKDWNNYNIKVHALKSTSRLIGAMELSKMAEALEMSTNSNEAPDIQKEHGQLIEIFLGYKKVLEPLTKENSSIEQNPEKSKEEISAEELSGKIQQMIDCATNFDIDGLDNLVKELSSVILPIDFSQKFSKIRTCVENIDFKELRILLSEWSSK